MAARFWIRLLRAGARLGPREWREEGLAEWEAELSALARRGASGGALLRFAMAGWGHALWRRKEDAFGLRGLLEDVRLALRRLARSPAFTFITVALLALGIGANTALLSALQQALRGGARYPDADRLVMVDLLMARNAGAPADTFTWSYPKFDFARERIRTVEPLAAFIARSVTLTGSGNATRIGVEMVSPPYFEVLGMAPLLGHGFGSSEEPPSRGAVAVLGHELWSSRFGGDLGVLGRTITLDGASFQVVGVMPRGFRGLSGRADLWLPLSGFATLGRTVLLTAAWSHSLRVVGKLEAQTTVEQARQELAAVGASLNEAIPGGDGTEVQGATAVPFLRARVNPVARLALLAVSAGGMLLLAIACANVAGLLLARASSRRTDLAVRAALGASRGRLLREGMLESLALALMGGAVGLGLAVLGEEVIARAVRYALETSGTRSLQYLDPDALGLDGRALLIGALLALGTGLLAGVLPLRAATVPDLGRDLRSGSAGGFHRLRGAARTGRGVVVSAQLALTLLLVSGAGLFAASFARLTAVPLGFTNNSVLVLDYDRGPGHSPDELLAFESDVMARVSALPGVQRVATGPCRPLNNECDAVRVNKLDDSTPAAPGHDLGVMNSYEVSPEYFGTLGIQLYQGRTFPTTLGPNDPPLAVIDRTAARELFGGDALGRRLAVSHELTDQRMAEVIGVIEDVREGGLEEDVLPAVYFSRSQAPRPWGTLFVQAAGDPRALLGSIRGVVRELDPSLALADVSTLADLAAAASARTRVLLGLLAAFSLLGLLLSAVGIYGMVSHDVQARSREVGLRVALGATARDVLGSVVSGPLLLVGVGATLGLLGAFFLSRQLQGLLFQVDAGDVRVLGAAALVLIGVGLVAALLPARRALLVDPAETLRGD